MFFVVRIGSFKATGSSGKTSVATRILPESANSLRSPKSAIAARLNSINIAPGCIHSKRFALSKLVLSVVMVAVTKMNLDRLSNSSKPKLPNDFFGVSHWEAKDRGQEYDF